MAESNFMSREELLQLAALDVFGLLDPFESELFNRSFHDAPATVQDEVMALQAEIAADPVFLSEAKPSASLRERVLERVARAVEEEAARLAPLATIGRQRGLAVDPAAVRSLQRAGLIWRAASFALAACLLITLVLFYRSITKGQEIASLALGERTSAQLGELLGEDFLQFLNSPSSDLVALAPANPTSGNLGGIWINERTNQVFVLGLDLPNGEYVLRATAAGGKSLAVKTFVSKSGVAGARIDAIDLAKLGVTTIAALSWEVVDQSGTVLIRSA